MILIGTPWRHGVTKREFIMDTVMIHTVTGTSLEVFSVAVTPPPPPRPVESRNVIETILRGLIFNH